jgi:hypothetical protein
VTPSTDDGLLINQQAATVAAAVLSEAVVAATRCQQVTNDMMYKESGLSALGRSVLRGSNTGRFTKYIRTGGLPDGFLLAVTAGYLHALEDRRDGGYLVPGKILQSWNRSSMRAQLGSSMLQRSYGVPDDHQILIVFLPVEAGNHPRQQAAARRTAATAGMPRRLMVARDEPSQRVIDTLVSASPGQTGIIGGNVVIGGKVVGAQPAADPLDRLSKLADLHGRGVITDEEFAVQKERILGES